MHTIRCLLPIAVVGVAGCLARGPIAVIPSDFPGFPAESGDEAVRAVATLYANHSSVFGADLTQQGRLPIAIRVGVQQDYGVPRRWLTAESFDAHLYLQDGTVLSSVSAEQAVSRRSSVHDRVTENALPLGELPAWEDAQEGFVFFRFEEPDVRVRGTHALVHSRSLGGESYRELELAQSLVSFTVVGDDGPQQVFVGLRRRHNDGH